MTASAAGAELLVGQAMADITFEYTGLTTYGNYSTWQATNINSPAMSMPGAGMQILVGDTIYFDASDQTTGTELWAYDTSNQSIWEIEVQTGEILTGPGEYLSVLVGDNSISPRIVGAQRCRRQQSWLAHEHPRRRYHLFLCSRWKHRHRIVGARYFQSLDMARG
ncbi:MAG: hypothetical protein CM15mP78_03480 [Candidatus Poseidoniales archaeon]|nr:MAG: hypothetical protein CM15mP78_03480 [Candidatus Poseidoniales archaeon]